MKIVQISVLVIIFILLQGILYLIAGWLRRESELGWLELAAALGVWLGVQLLKYMTRPERNLILAIRYELRDTGGNPWYRW
jgi:hypothetical protein